MNRAFFIFFGCLLASSAPANSSIAMDQNALEQEAVSSPDIPKESTPESEPTLDDLDALLGITDESTQQAPEESGEAAQDRVEKTELDRALTGREVRDQLVQAIQQMSETADRLAVLNDPGIATQRLQQEVITKLEQLIKEVEKQSKGKQGQQQQQQQQQQQSQQQQNQKQQSDQQQGTESESAGEGENTPPARQREELRSLLDAASASWGNLPAHYRDGLQQARDQYISELYERLTQAYYRKLAEEATPRQ